MKPCKCLLCVSACVLATGAGAQPVTSAWNVGGADYPVATAAASVAGWYATADSRGDVVEVRDIDRRLVHSISAAEMTVLLPWMNFNSDGDGPTSLCFSDSGRWLFIGVCDTVNAPDGQPGDAVLRYDTSTGVLSVFARAELGGFNTTNTGSLAFAFGRLYTAFSGTVRVFNAGHNDATGSQLGTQVVGTTGVRTVVAVDRNGPHMYVGNGSTVYRAPLGTLPQTFTSVGTTPATIQGLAWSDQYGATANAGLYVLYPSATGAGDAQIGYVSTAMARGQTGFAPSVYVRGMPGLVSLCATADGAMLAGAAAGDALVIRDASDTRLSYTGFVADEFAQVVRFGKGLISPDGEPAGWVIDGDVQIGWTRFHPATPDGAAWTVLLLLMNHHINGDPQALPLVRQILNRYAGLAAGPRPSRNADGIYRHWIDPVTGGVKPGWDPEYSTMSTMKIVLAAARARAYFAGDAQIDAAAREIICGVSNWDRYFDAQSRMYLTGLAAGGGDPASLSGGWHEGVLFADEAGVYGSGNGVVARSRWLDRGVWPSGAFISGRGVTSTGWGQIGPAFITVYPLLTIQSFRTDAAWMEHVANFRASNGAWTDDNSPKYYTVFSAGTNPDGYNADSLAGHPYNITTFPALMGFAAGGGTAEVVGAYHAYRMGARQTFLSGASILYRRSQAQLAYQPNSAGLPDVAMGGLALADVLMPGSVEAVLTGGYPSCDCPSDWNHDGGVDGADVQAFFADWESGGGDINGDGGVDGADVQTFFGYWEGGC
ncbi:MAG: hypothetical protein JSR77_06515 [Planctomycetes bacterium]|nr:hypothetical protein [Planctomycetota bacterium]